MAPKKCEDEVLFHESVPKLRSPASPRPGIMNLSTQIKYIY